MDFVRFILSLLLYKVSHTRKSIHQSVIDGGAFVKVVIVEVVISRKLVHSIFGASIYSVYNLYINEMKLIVFGISGITGGGKTTLANRLHTYLSDPLNANAFDGFHINKAVVIHQDKYFYARDSPHHQWIPEIKFINREILTAMNMDKFAEDLAETVQQLTEDDSRHMTGDNNEKFNGIDEISPSNHMSTTNQRMNVNILIIEGFLIYNDNRINQYCQLRFHVHLSYEVGVQRRLIRTFKHVNPQPELYFANYIWPLYHKHLDQVPNKSDLIFLSGEQQFDEIFQQARAKIATFLANEYNNLADKSKM